MKDATEQARPLREFMLELSVGPTTKRWLDRVQPVVQALAKAAAQWGRSDPAEQLTSLTRALDRSARATGSRLEGNARSALLTAYEPLTQTLPRVFGLESERTRRESLIVRHLLLQVPGLSEATIEQIIQGEPMSLGSLYRSSIEDLVAHRQIDRDEAAALVERVQAYWSERTAQPLEKGQDEAQQRLHSLTNELSRTHADFQEAEAAEDRVQKRRARRQRHMCALELNVLLAQLGDTELVLELERLPTEGKVQRVRSHIEHSAPPNGPVIQEAS